MKFSARLSVILVSLTVGFLFLSPQKILADWKAFEPSIERIVQEEIDARAIESKDTSGKTTEVFSSRITSNNFNETLAAGVFSIGGTGPLTLNNPNFSQAEKGGAIGTLAQAIGTIYANPPASGFAWVYDTMANAGFLAKPTYAQGIGFAGLIPLLPLWKTARNISYSILIIIMVVVGFMIIFRAKIDPKTVISVQAALPRIIFTLILITLSYPIAGFLIDLMYLAMAIVINLLASGLSGVNLAGTGLDDFTKTALQQTEFITGGWLKLIGSVFNFKLFIPLFNQALLGSPGTTAGIGLAGAIGALLATTLASAVVGGPWGIALSTVIVPLVILFIIFLGLLFTLIRITFLLLNSYIQVLITVILGPLLLLKEAIPGQSAFKEWLQNLIANLIVFPATVGIIYSSWVLTLVAWKGNLWIAPLIPVGGGGNENGNPLAIFMGLGVIFLAPNLIASVKKAFHPKPVLPITAGSAFSPITGAAQTGMGAMSQFYYMNQIFGGTPHEPGKGTFSTFGNVFRGIFGRK